MAHEIRHNPELKEWFCARCGRSSDHAMREDAEVELNVWPCEMYQHVISPFRHDKDEPHASAKEKCNGCMATEHLRKENPNTPAAASSFPFSTIF